MTQQTLIKRALTHFRSSSGSLHGSQKKLAKALGVTPPFIWQMLQPVKSKYHRKFPLSLAVVLERVTNGKVTARQMFPKFFGALHAQNSVSKD